MADIKTTKLINLLIVRTAKSELKWETTDKEDVFQLPFSDYTIRLSIGSSPTNPNDIAYYVNIYNSNGQLMDSINDEDVKDYFEDSFSRFRDLHSNARRKALGVDKAIDDILDELNLPF